MIIIFLTFRNLKKFQSTFRIRIYMCIREGYAKF